VEELSKTKVQVPARNIFISQFHFQNLRDGSLGESRKETARRRGRKRRRRRRRKSSLFHFCFFFFFFFFLMLR